MPIRKHAVSGSSGMEQPRQEPGALIHVIRTVIRRPVPGSSQENQEADGVISDALDRISGCRIEITRRAKREISQALGRFRKVDRTRASLVSEMEIGSRPADHGDDVRGMLNPGAVAEMIKPLSAGIKMDGGVISRVIKHGQGVLTRIKRKWWAINLRKYDILGRCFCVGVSYRGANQELMIFTPHANYRRLRSFSSERDGADCHRASANPEAGAPNPAADLLIPRPNPAANPDSNDTVVINIGIVGDSDTGKTSFMAKYVAVDQSEDYVETMGVAWMEKVFNLQSVNITLSIRDLGGHWQCSSMLPIVCTNAAAIFIMFDLTRRSTLHSVKEWFMQARECNKAAITVIIGTKYDRFVQFPPHIQIAIIRQARCYAKVMDAALFFSSVTHNINVHKIFKVIVAKVFDLPCNISRNLNPGEPIIDY